MCEMSNSERFPRLYHTHPIQITGKSRLLSNHRIPKLSRIARYVKTCIFVKTIKIQDFLCSQHFVAYQGISHVNSCVAKGCKSIRSAPECCHLNSGSHPSGLEYSEHIWEVVFPVAEHGGITQLLRNCKKVREAWKNSF